MLFLYPERCMEIFSRKYGTFLKQIATPALQKAFTDNLQINNAFRHSILLAVGTYGLVLLHKQVP